MASVGELVGGGVNVALGLVVEVAAMSADGVGEAVGSVGLETATTATMAIATTTISPAGHATRE